MWHFKIIIPPTKLAKKNQLGNNNSLVADPQNLLTHSIADHEAGSVLL